MPTWFPLPPYVCHILKFQGQYSLDPLTQVRPMSSVSAASFLPLAPPLLPWVLPPPALGSPSSQTPFSLEEAFSLPCDSPRGLLSHKKYVSWVMLLVWHLDFLLLPLSFHHCYSRVKKKKMQAHSSLTPLTSPRELSPFCSHGQSTRTQWPH